MPFTQTNEIRYFQFNTLNTCHAVFTRHGGVSPEPWGSLNLGGSVGDNPEHIKQNRLRAFAALHLPADSVFDVWQIHSADVVHATAPRDPNNHQQQADILITDKADVTLYMRFADCVPLLLHDPRKSVIAISHAGWQGTLRDVATVTVRAMQEKYNCNPADIIAGIGPSIGPDHYEVGEEVITKVNQIFGETAEQLLHTQPSGKIHFDLWKTNKLILHRAGIEHVEVAGVCTACNTQDWFSHRAEKGRTGRFGALIALQ